MKKRTALTVSVVALLASLALTSAPAFADEAPDNDPGKVAAVGPGAPQTGVDTVYSSGSASSKSAGVQPLVTTTCLSTCTLQDSHSLTIHPSGGSSASLTTGYTTTFVSEYSDVNFKSGSSYGRWLGATPVNATKMSLTDNWSVAAIGSASVSVPGGVGFSVGPNVAHWTTSVNNTWQLTHNFSNVKFTGSIISSTEDTTVSAEFGSQGFMTNT